MFTQILDTSNRLQSLDFLRGFAIFIVFLTHFEVLDLQAVGVDLFFVLSGHLVSVSLWSTLRKSESGTSYLIFFLKRLFRIIPAYYTFLVVGYVLAVLLLKDISPQDIPLPREFPQYFFFYRNYGGPPSRWSMEHLWSLCVEEQFYWILPLMMASFALFFAKQNRRFLAAALALLAMGIGLKAQAMVTDFAEWPTYTHNRLDAFGWGILITILGKRKQGTAHPLFNHKGLLILGAGALLLCLTVLSPLPELLLRTISPICWFLVILGMYQAKSRYFAPFRVLAFFSYGIYLWHFLFVIPVQHYFGKGLVGFTVYALVTLFFAVLSSLVVERPFLRFRDRFLQKLFPRKNAEVLHTPEVPIP
ncbi:acyltransferase family protein [Rufibacter psychrotolerans]|uniref:acyltransferase family protein n=1 Tax=Rufibacter psychrotolerans TaxID=2812556 RepID=UPI001966E954|nr:acyltransferase [Rufibacter sp. SYSU D00308]